MSAVIVFGDIELAALVWAKAQGFGAQVGFAVPNKTPPLPFLQVTLISEVPQFGDTPLVNSRIQFSCWAKVNDKATAMGLARAVATAAHLMSPFTTETPQGATTLHGANVDQTLWIPEPDSALARATVDVIFTATTSSEEG